MSASEEQSTAVSPYEDPNRPWSPDELKDELEIDDADLLAIKKELPILNEVIEFFDELIADSLNPNIIAKVTPSTPAEDVKQAAMFAQRNSRVYSKKRKQFADRFQKYIEDAKKKMVTEE